MKINQDSVAIVTGGASGLGEATARLLAKKGAPVALFDLDEKRGSKLAEEIGGIFCHADVSVEESVEKAFAASSEKLGVARILVNCAGVGYAQKTASRDKSTNHIIAHDMDLFARTIGINLIGTFRCLSKAAAGMLSLEPLGGGERGVIINTASIAAEDGQIGQAAYSASKGGILGLTLPARARSLQRRRARLHDFTGSF